MGLQIYRIELSIMSITSVFKENLEYVCSSAKHRNVRKPTAKLGLSSLNQVNTIALEYSLKMEEKQLLRLIEIQKLGFSQIGQIIGCSRQNVEQKYKAVLKKICPSVFDDAGKLRADALDGNGRIKIDLLATPF
jgi:predicted DNA-binding protein (UPF0251 family)